MIHKEFCKRGHDRSHRNKTGHCKLCAAILRNKGRTYKLVCQRGHILTDVTVTKDKHRRCIECQKLSPKRRIQNITDSHVRCSLKLNKAQATPEIIELTRSIIILKREIINANN